MGRSLHVGSTGVERLNDLTHTIIGAAVAVHRELGPGLLESAYERCLAIELVDRGLKTERQKSLPLVYRGRPVGRGYRADLLVEETVLVEVKSVERLDRIHTAQVLSYLRLSGCRIGLLINFNVRWLTEDGVKRLIQGFG